ncbi:hypothetical protein [Mesorhizobium temperatum]|uniref:Uncharacterized protein n=1 Tax=Mesorhizobium temperatum TaxID=241416 RepID=A0A271LCC4_9HYPH|nr:hypothetical protein [Mesorhizobium temperatum]PAQ05734.1 hypothetical protein CIT26_26175 [Mesorhizobium temperatum]
MSTAPTVEPFCVSDTFVTGAGPLQFMGDNLRLTLFVLQRSTYDGGTENAVVSKLVGSRSDMLKIAADILKGCHAHAPKDKIKDAFVEFLEGPTGRH